MVLVDRMEVLIWVVMVELMVVVDEVDLVVEAVAVDLVEIMMQIHHGVQLGV